MEIWENHIYDVWNLLRGRMFVYMMLKAKKFLIEIFAVQILENKFWE